MEINFSDFFSIDSKLLHVRNLTLTKSNLSNLIHFLSSQNIIHLFFSSVQFENYDLLKNLDKNLNLKYLFFEDCQLSNSLDFLPKLCSKLDDLEEISLKSCKIFDEDCDQICKIIKGNSGKLKKINLENNQIKSIGANQICITLQLNTRLENLNLNGNDEIEKEILRDIDRYLERNQTISLKSDKEIKNLTQRQVIKSNLEKDLESQKKNAKEKEKTLLSLIEKCQINEQNKKSLLLKFNKLQEEKSILKSELQALEQEFDLIEKRTVFKQENLELKLDENKLLFAKSKQLNEDQIHNFNFEKERSYQDAINNFDRKYLSLINEYRYFESIKNDLEENILILKEEFLIKSIQMEEDFQRQQEKGLLKYKKNYEKFKDEKENHLLDIKNEKKFNEIRNKELHKNLDKIIKRENDKLESKAKDLNKQKKEINHLHHKLSEKNLLIEKKKIEILHEELAISTLIQSFNEKKHNWEIQKEQLFYEKTIEEQRFLNEENIWKQEQEALQRRISEINQRVDLKKAENNRIRLDYEGLSGEVNINIGRIIRDFTLNENKF